MTEPNEALNDSLNALCKTFDEIELKHKKKLSNEEYCMECFNRKSCPEWGSKIICDLNYYIWLQKVKDCREQEVKNGNR